MAFFILLANLAPVLLFPIFFKFKPVEDSDLTERLLDLTRRAGTRVRGVFEWKLSEKTKKANAALVGLGTRAASSFRTRCSKNLTPKRLRRSWRTSLATTFIITFSAAWSSDPDDLSGILPCQPLPAAVGVPLWAFGAWRILPTCLLLILVGTGLSVLLLPGVNGHSRWLERQADAYALAAIPNRSAFITSMEKLAEINLSERQPPAWIEFIFHSHPSIEKRIAFAERGA